MRKSKEAPFFDQIPRSKTDNTHQQKIQKKKRRQGNSQFIKSKFDVDYEPKFRALKLNKSPYASKQQIKTPKPEQLNQLVTKTQEEVKRGKKIVIDWNLKNNFRTTRFPSLDEKYLQPKRSITEQVHIYDYETPKKAKQIEFFAKLEKDGHYKDIIEKGEYLRALISQSIAGKRILRSKQSMKFKTCASQSLHDKDLTKSQNLSSSQVSKYNDPHCNYALIEEVEEKNRQFFEKNNEKIIKAMNYERKLEDSFQDLNSKIKSNKNEIISQRIVCKSKLALLKSELIRKFKDIKQGMLDDNFDQKTGRIN